MPNKNGLKKGSTITVEPIRKQKDIKSISRLLRSRPRDHLLWVMGMQSEYVFICLEETPFCVEYYGGPFSERRHLMKRLCGKAGVKPFGFHAIRHIASTSIYRNGNNASVVQRILRHKSPTTTNRYLESMGIEGVRDALESHDKGNDERFNGKNKESTDYIFGGK